MTNPEFCARRHLPLRHRSGGARIALLLAFLLASWLHWAVCVHSTGCAMAPADRRRP